MVTPESAGSLSRRERHPVDSDGPWRRGLRAGVLLARSADPAGMDVVLAARRRNRLRPSYSDFSTVNAIIGPRLSCSLARIRRPSSGSLVTEHRAGSQPRVLPDGYPARRSPDRMLLSGACATDIGGFVTGFNQNQDATTVFD